MDLGLRPIPNWYNIISLAMKSQNGCLKGCLIILVATGSLFILAILVSIFIPKSSLELYREAENHYYQDNFFKALASIEKAIEKDSSNAEHHFLKAKIYYELHDTVVSKMSLLKSQTIAKNDSVKYELIKKIIDWKLGKNDTAEAKALLNKVPFLFKKEDVENYTLAHYYLAGKMYAIGEGEESSKHLRALLDSIQEFKNDTLFYQKVYHTVSNGLLKMGESNQSTETLKKLVKEIPSSKRAYKILGESYANKSRNREAITFFKRYLEYDTLNLKVYTAIGLCYMNLNQKTYAKKYFKIAADGGDKEACSHLRELTAKTRYYTQTKCCDGTTSSSTGRGTCSHHGGVCGTTYLPYKKYTMSCD